MKNDFEYYWNCDSVLLYGGNRPTRPFFSIMIPTYKRPQLLAQSVNSVLSQKRFDDYEIVICDNEQTRNTETEQYIMSLNHSKIVYYKNTENLGPHGNFVKLLRYSKGKWLMLLDDDDMISPYYLYILYKYITLHNFNGMVGTRNNTFCGSDEFKFSSPLGKTITFSKIGPVEFFFGKVLCSPGQAMPRKLYIQMTQKINSFAAGDQKIQYYALRKRGLVRCEMPLAAYRVSDSISKNILKQIFKEIHELWNEIADDISLINIFRKCFMKEYTYHYVQNGIRCWKSKLKTEDVMKDLDYEGDISTTKMLLMNKIIDYTRGCFGMYHKMFDERIKIDETEGK